MSISTAGCSRQLYRPVGTTQNLACRVREGLIFPAPTGTVVSGSQTDPVYSSEAPQQERLRACRRFVRLSVGPTPCTVQQDASVNNYPAVNQFGKWVSSGGSSSKESCSRAHATRQRFRWVNREWNQLCKSATVRTDAGLNIVRKPMRYFEIDLASCERLSNVCFLLRSFVFAFHAIKK